jgi:uncharacterized protein with PIN domain
MIQLRWGEFSETCKVHGETAEKFGTLVDCNGHMWLICDKCINSLWDERSFMKMQEMIEERAEEIAMQKIRERLFGNDAGV